MKTRHQDRPAGLWLRRLLGAASIHKLLLWAICGYGALLRFEAFHRAYGPLVGSDLFIRAQSAVAGLATRLHPASLQWPRAAMPYRFDAKSYLVSARRMEHFYEARLREPLFVFSTKVGLWLTGGQDITVSLVSSVFGSLLIPATYVLGRAIGGVVVGLGAALLVAIEPQLIDTGVRGYRDDLFSLLTVLFAWACIRFYDRASTRTVLLTAAIGAAACLTRITALSFVVPGLAAVVAVRGRGRWREVAKPAMVAGVIVLVLIAPFLVTCWMKFGDPLYSINWAADFYGQRSGLDTTGGMSTIELLRRQFDRAPLEMIDSTIRGFTHYPWANKWAELGLHWGGIFALALKYLCLVGLLMWLWSPEGRLTLVVLAGSMVPFVFTWEAHTQWRLTQHTYPFYMVAAVFAVARPLQWVVTLLRSGQRVSGELEGALVRTLLTASVVAGLFGVVALLPPLILYRELASGRPASVGGDARALFFMEREVFFFASGWSAPHTEGNVTFHDPDGNRSRLRVPMSAKYGYRCLLRLDANPALDDHSPGIELRVNDWSVRPSSPDASAGVARYWATIPRGVVRTGLNRVEIVAVGGGGSESTNPAQTSNVPQSRLRFWYVRFFPQT
jgi:hypothetical protein